MTEALIDEDKEDLAMKVVEANLSKMPDAAVPYDYTTPTTVELLFQLGNSDKAIEIAEIISQRADEQLEYYLRNRITIGFEVQKNLVVLQSLMRTMDRFGENDLAEKYGNLLRVHSTTLGMYDGNPRNR